MPVSGICLSHGLVSGGVTAAEMEKCRWLKPRLVAAIEYLERTAANHLRHAMFSGLTEERGTVPLAIESQMRSIALLTEATDSC
jgi:ATP-dependent DNA ligase